MFSLGDGNASRMTHGRHQCCTLPDKRAGPRIVVGQTDPKKFNEMYSRTYVQHDLESSIILYDTSINPTISCHIPFPLT